MDICLWTLSVTRREQFSEEKLKKLAVIRPLKTKLLYVQGQIRVLRRLAAGENRRLVVLGVTATLEIFYDTKHF